MQTRNWTAPLAINNPIVILAQSHHPRAIGERERPESIEPGADHGQFRSPTAQTQRTNQPYLYHNRANPNTILNPYAIPMQSRNPSTIQAEEKAEG